jgi:hypothetical protein
MLKLMNLPPFKKERDIQNTIERNTHSFFGLKFIGIEILIGNYRIITIGFHQIEII